MITFIEKLKPLAIRHGKDFQILPSLICGVACLESNYGKSGLSKDAHNLFGIKGSYKGQSISLPTTEYKNGVPIRTTANFRKYPSIEESIIDFCNLLTKGVSWDRNLYRKVVNAKDYQTASREFGSSPYATDINYRDKLVKVIETNHFDDLDHVTVPKPKPSPIPTPIPTSYKEGDRGALIGKIEDYFHLPVDDVFGSLLTAYVKVFQNEHNLKPTGIVDQETIKYMNLK